MIGAGTLFAFSIIAAIFFSIGSDAVNFVFQITGLVLGILYAILGVFGIVKVTKSQEGSY